MGPTDRTAGLRGFVGGSFLLTRHVAWYIAPSVEIVTDRGGCRFSVGPIRKRHLGRPTEEERPRPQTGRASGGRLLSRVHASGPRADPGLRDRAHVRGLRALFALGDLVLDSLTLAQGTLACPLDAGGVYEDILAPIIR